MFKDTKFDIMDVGGMRQVFSYSKRFLLYFMPVLVANVHFNEWSRKVRRASFLHRCGKRAANRRSGWRILSNSCTWSAFIFILNFQANFTDGNRIPVVLVANKQDSAEALGSLEIIQRFRLARIKDRKWLHFRPNRKLHRFRQDGPRNSLSNWRGDTGSSGLCQEIKLDARVVFSNPILVWRTEERACK